MEIGLRRFSSLFPEKGFKIDVIVWKFLHRGADLLAITLALK